MSTAGRAGRPAVRVQFDPDVWKEEVGRLRPGSQMREVATAARRRLDSDPSTAWLPCQADGPGGTKLVGCVKVYLPLDREPSVAPYAFVLQLVAAADGQPTFVLRLLAFGERHPERPGTRSVYQRAHKRLHGRYPDE